MFYRHTYTHICTNMQETNRVHKYERNLWKSWQGIIRNTFSLNQKLSWLKWMTSENENGKKTKQYTISFSISIIENLLCSWSKRKKKWNTQTSTVKGFSIYIWKQRKKWVPRSACVDIRFICIVSRSLFRLQCIRFSWSIRMCVQK